MLKNQYKSVLAFIFLTLLLSSCSSDDDFLIEEEIQSTSLSRFCNQDHLFSDREICIGVYSVNGVARHVFRKVLVERWSGNGFFISNLFRFIDVSDNIDFFLKSQIKMQNGSVNVFDLPDNYSRVENLPYYVEIDAPQNNGALISIWRNNYVPNPSPFSVEFRMIFEYVKNE